MEFPKRGTIFFFGFLLGAIIADGAAFQFNSAYLIIRTIDPVHPGRHFTAAFTMPVLGITIDLEIPTEGDLRFN